MGVERLPAPGWRTKKRIIQRPTGVARPTPRAPSHFKTQVCDPSYQKIRALCTRLAKEVEEDEERAVRTFTSHMETFVSSAGVQLLERMQNKKKLAELVVDQLNGAKRIVDTVVTEFLTDHIFLMFPQTHKERDYCKYFDRMQCVADHVDEVARLRDHEAVARHGSRPVEWDEDDPFSSTLQFRDRRGVV